MASEYGWQLLHIFEYVTIKDVKQLMPYATQRRRRRDGDHYKNLINIVHIASYHPQKGTNSDLEKLYRSYDEQDHSYVNAKLDTNGLNALANLAATNRAKAAVKHR